MNKRRIVMTIFLPFLAFGSIRCTGPEPRVEATRPPIHDVRPGMLIVLTGTTDLYVDVPLFDENLMLVIAGSKIRTHKFFDPMLLLPGDEVRYLGDYRVVVEAGRYKGQLGRILPEELR